jgi:hypothetical protein
MMRSRVVLPQPLGPSSTPISPAARVRSMSRSTGWPPNDFSISAHRNSINPTLSAYQGRLKTLLITYFYRLEQHPVGNCTIHVQRQARPIIGVVYTELNRVKAGRQVGGQRNSMQLGKGITPAVTTARPRPARRAGQRAGRSHPTNAQKSSARPEAAAAPASNPTASPLPQ